MFTGIIEEKGKIKKISHEQKGLRFHVEAEKILIDIKNGDSISVDGVCLTVEKFEKKYFVVYVMHETIKKTTLSYYKVNQSVNLERALIVNSRLGGHFVLGHVDTVGRINKIKKDGDAKIFEIVIPEEYNKYLVQKGSIAIDGISLTIVDIYKKSFTVSIIPHTQKITTLTDKKNQDIVNIEFDILAKQVVRLLPDLSDEKKTGKLTEKKLRELCVL